MALLQVVRAGPESNALEAILHNKQRALQSQLSSLPSQQQLARLTSLPPSASPHLLLTALRSSSSTAIVAEVARLSPAESPQSLASRCKNYVQSGADAIAVRTDEEASPDGLADLIAVCSAVQVPVIQTDWFLHPIQIAESREAGAAALTLVHAILKNGLWPLQSYALSLGLDSIVELEVNILVLQWMIQEQHAKHFDFQGSRSASQAMTDQNYIIVNLKDLEAASRQVISVYGINLSIKLSLPVPGLRQDVAKSLLEQLPDGAQSIVGIMSMEEALELKLAGASALYLRHDVWQDSRHGHICGEAFLKKLRDILANS
ncbi:hypothetical protein L7F22_034713 [Adiantum nelumboides]|nr:hypothetical protein [Adiantum nelumboides]